MIKVALVGAGKMGVSHLAILGAHPDVEVVGVCDTSKIVTNFLERYSKLNCYADFEKMLDRVKPEAVFIAVPTKFHHKLIKMALERDIHVFAEKPFCLNTKEGEELIALASRKKLINQVGYHNKFVGTFKEVKKIIKAGMIGEVYHFVAESYGPVVTKAKQNSWRSNPEEGGGCLMDYASHVIDLVNDIVAPITEVKGATLKSIYSNTVEDAVYSVLSTKSNVSGILSVNWSEDTYRKMSTTVTILGSKGKIISDANELKLFLKDDNRQEYTKGWNVRYVTDLTEQVNYNLRGEEYSAQVDYFVDAVMKRKPNTINTFQQAWETDKVIELLKSHR